MTCSPRYPCASLTDTQAKVDKLASDLDCKLKEMQTLTVTQKDFEAMEKEVAWKTKELEDMGKKIDTRDKVSLDLEVCNTMF